MGGHGGINILFDKEWNVYNRDNIKKFRNDEEKAKFEKIKKEKERINQKLRMKYLKLIKDQKNPELKKNLNSVLKNKNLILEDKKIEESEKKINFEKTWYQSKRKKIKKNKKNLAYKNIKKIKKINLKSLKLKKLN